MQTGAVADQNCKIQSEFCDFLSDLGDSQFGGVRATWFFGFRKGR